MNQDEEDFMSVEGWDVKYLGVDNEFFVVFKDGQKLFYNGATVDYVQLNKIFTLYLKRLSTDTI